jgi:hypothetical protein
VTKAAYSPPRLRQFESAVFLTPTWDAPAEDNSFRNLRPLYLVCRKQQFSVSAVRFKPEGEQEFRDWQAVSVVDGNDICLLGIKAHTWLLLGFIPPGVRFEVELRCCDAHGRIGIAGCHNLIALESRSFELAQL